MKMIDTIRVVKGPHGKMVTKISIGNTEFSWFQDKWDFFDVLVTDADGKQLFHDNFADPDRFVNLLDSFTSKELVNKLKWREEIKKQAEVVVEKLMIEDSDILVIDKVISDFDEFIDSEELKNVHSGFQSKTGIKKEWFKEAYVVGDDVFVSYNIEGVNHLKKESITTSIDNYGLYNVIIAPNFFIVNKDSCYDKSENNFKAWASDKNYMTLINATY